MRFFRLFSYINVSIDYGTANQLIHVLHVRLEIQEESNLLHIANYFQDRQIITIKSVDCKITQTLSLGSSYTSEVSPSICFGNKSTLYCH